MSTPRLFCPSYFKIAYTVSGPKEALFARLRCKRWTCDFCAEKNAWIWRQWLKKRLPEVSGCWWLVTITASPHKRLAATSLHNIRSGLDALFKRLRRCFTAVNYVRVYEKHPTSQAIHAHLIMSGLTPFVQRSVTKKGKISFKGIETRAGRKGTWAVRSWFKKTCHELGMGYIVDVQKMDNGIERAIWYVTKYLTKALQDLKVPFLRHVQVSTGIGSPPREREAGWKVANFIEARDFEPNTRIVDQNTKFIVDNNWWEKHSFYPFDEIEALTAD